MSGQALVIERPFQAPAEAVFDAWTSEEVMRRWFHGQHDWETTEAHVDLRLGGNVRVVMCDPENDVEYGGGAGTDGVQAAADGRRDLVRVGHLLAVRP